MSISSSEELAAALGAKSVGAGTWMATCPTHHDRKPSLAISSGSNGIPLVHCHAGCAQETVVAALKDRGLWPPPTGPQIEREYDYVDEDGVILFQTVRYRPKDFRQRQPDGDDWVWNLKGVRRVLYRLPDVLIAKRVFVVEGEKDVERLRGWRLTATTSPMGAGKWRSEYAQCLAGKDVIILPDDDEPGKAHAETVAASVLPVAKSVRVVSLAAKDVSAWASKGGTKAKLLQLVKSTPVLNKDEVRETRVVRETRSAAEWPKPLGDAAFHGVAGDLVKAIEPESEADPAALLVQFLVGFGNVIGRGPHFVVEADQHHMNLFTVIVGETAKARKGVSWGHVNGVLDQVDSDWTKRRVVGGLSTGEGLIQEVRDGLEIDEDDDDNCVKGVKRAVDPFEKRILVREGEFGRVLTVSRRETNILSAVMREAWDTGHLSVLRSTDKAKVTEAHISLIGHITQVELRRLITPTSLTNGFANRILWTCARRSKLLPEGGNFTLSPALLARLRKAYEFAKKAGRLQKSDKAKKLWARVYQRLSGGKPGLLDTVTSRSEAQVMRLACLYTLLDRHRTIKTQHLLAALEVWRYCEDSARYIFGDSTDDPVADELLVLLRKNPEGTTRAEIYQHFGRNKPKAEISRSLSTLQEHGLARMEREKQPHSKRPIETWFAVGMEVRD